MLGAPLRPLPHAPTTMRNPPLAALLAAALLAPLTAQNPSSDVAVGVFPFLVGNMDGRINEIVTNCVTHGIDTLYVSAFRTTAAQTGDLWITDSAGDWNPAWGPVRSTGAGIHLQNLITACHAQNVRVVAVLKCFADTVQPDDAAHKQYLLGVIDYFVDAWQANGRPVYDLDGIALDYVRYVGGTGVNPANVTNFLADVRQHIGNLSLHAYLIANRYTFDGPVYNSQFASYATVIASLAAQFGQQWEQMAAYVDVMMPMTYTADGSIYGTYAAHQAYVQQAAAYARTACTIAGHPQRRVIPVVKTYTGDSETTTVQTIEASIRGALLGGGDGYQSFRYQFLVNNPTWWTPMAQFATPGCNWPEPSLATTVDHLTVSADPTASVDVDQSAASLQVRFDLDGDGAFDTPWQASATALGLGRHLGTWVTTLQVRDADGHISTTRRRWLASAPITVTPPAVSTATGGSVQVAIDCGAAGAGNVYLAIAGITGTYPGFVWQPGFAVPLNVDALTSLLAADPNGLVLANGYGTFDANGQATATFTLPPAILQFLAGWTMHWSFLSQDTLGQPRCVGNAAPLLLLP